MHRRLGWNVAVWMVLAGLAALAACSGPGDSNPQGGNGSGGGGSGGSGGNGSSGGALEPQPWVEVVAPGQSWEDENRDQDGWCVGGEGAYACDDGAAPGSGGEPPPGWNSSGGACQTQPFSTAGRAAAEMLLVVDRSGSMNEVPPGDSQTKWRQVVGVLGAVTAQLEDRVDFGLALFPSTDSCGEASVQVGVGAQAAAGIAQALAGTGPNGGTPTGASLRVARTYLQARNTNRPRAVVLATDGAPNCAGGYNPQSCTCTTAGCDASTQCLDESGAVSAVTALHDVGISTFVVGIPGTEGFAQVLDAMAVAGGTAQPAGGPRYYATTGAAGLQDALDAIARRVANCRFELNGAPQDPGAVTVQVDGQGVAPSPNQQNGWGLDGATLELFGAACDRLADGADHNVTVTYCYVPGG